MRKNSALDGAQFGDADETRFAAFEQYRGLLFSIAYRMLGSVADAEDMLQETFLRWRLASDPEIRSPRAFLVTIVSRLCINHLQSARVQREKYVGQWLPEPLMTDPASDPLASVMIDESLSMAFLVLLERLTPAERAVFLLREVFEYEYSEIADVLGQSETNCRQILRRARQHVDAERPRFPASAQKQVDLLERFLQAVGGGDLDGLVSVLSHDVVLHTDGGGKAAAAPNLIHGADHVARAILGGTRKFTPANLEPHIAQINGEAGIILYLDGKAYSVLTMDSQEERIRSIYFVTNPEKLTHLPSLPAHSV
ncbi:DNA-directed RNA polymerase sigma-70 factor [Capsulimonas corticalis]|uniref:DNA-directed RNA polymerase sigma-70 factor n=1 Tax=Capsulimonas corticalis TaxID=2219043 RepID=A0A402CPM5_9BACT|nr:RNA polymerase sigma-70 factor [Capsulimonas corticalis]BDI32951.1 DNA-directed RNA polymerase sigma-70 factor [Capsulimonas corticalis]